LATYLINNKTSYSVNNWILLQFFFLLSALVLNSIFLNSLYLCFIIYSISSISILRLFRFLPRIGNDFLDPGFLVVFFNILTIIPMTASMLIGIEVLRIEWAISQIEIFIKVVYLHLVFIPAFAITYYLINRKSNPTTSFNFSLLTNKVWIYLFFTIALIVLIINISSGNFYSRADGSSGVMVQKLFQDHSFLSRQIFSRLSNLESYAMNIAFGVILCRAKTIERARIYMFVLPILYFTYSFVFQGSRAAATILIPMIAFADIVRWKGKLLNWPLFLFVFLGGFLFMHFVEVLETFFLGGGFGNWQVALFTALEPRMVENVGAITVMVDDLNVPLRYGSSYLDAFKALIPNQLVAEPVVPLSEWFMQILYGKSIVELGNAWAFSSIAEGYLNFKVYGVVLSGFITALLASLIRYFKCSRKLSSIGPVLFTSSILISYKLLRNEFVDIIKKFEWTIILVFVLIFLAIVILAASKKDFNLKGAS